ncbi:NAD(P)/FAD-dependent oxidoreductase [Caldivirga maquilingensis]|uniref:Monooxygenase FAD-binding n=1 Tax=Caldivirga maquilingensis (strain ATCC 700844 / DSM 13496 / JCM 10307 / IC-167) TaxID=397948 RepID=A8MD19_CALMQ|nr:NAD(P)/FAD-dependent oxidoreductase [Caldivirga maquilingensis]ABW01675.1 monooxygenase FAD-binding [Caldivirga maquilingensis IC-167]
MVSINTELLIIGGGPAGSFLASEVNLGDVTLLDKKKINYGPVVCGEMMPKAELLVDYLPSELMSMIEYTLYKSIRRSIIVNHIKTLRVLIRVKGTIIDLGSINFPAYIVNKGLMISRIINDAANKGVRVNFSSTVTGCIKHGDGFKCRVMDNDGEHYVETHLLAGADGYPSVVRELANNPPFNPMDTAVATSQRAMGWGGSLDEAVVIMDPILAPGGYAWVFPRGDGSSNVGLGIRGYDAWVKGINPVNLHSEFLKSLNLKPTQRSILLKTIPVGELGASIEGNGVYLLGDAAGTVVSTNGAGINTAMVSGLILAKVLKEGLSYGTEMRRVLGSFLSDVKRLRELADPMLYDEDALAKLTRIMPRETVKWVIKEAMLASVNPMLRIGARILLSLIKARGRT